MRERTVLEHQQAEAGAMAKELAKARRMNALETRSSVPQETTTDITAALDMLLADLFALHVKTKNFHWHVSGPHFRSCHLLFEEQATQNLDMADDIPERVRRIGGMTLRSIGHIARLQHVLANGAEFVPPHGMLAELQNDNEKVTKRMREIHALCEQHGDVATASLLGVWIDEAQRRTSFLFDSIRRNGGSPD